MKKFLSTTSYLLKNANVPSKVARSSLTNPLMASGFSTDTHLSSVTHLWELRGQSFQERVIFLAEEKLHINHGLLGDMLEESTNEVLIDTWGKALQSIKSLLETNKASAAKRQNETLIEEIGKLPYLLEDVKVKLLLCEANVIKGNILGRTSPYETDQQQALACYRTALKLVPDHPAAKRGLECLLATRGESDKIQIVAVDSSESPFNFRG